MKIRKGLEEQKVGKKVKIHPDGHSADISNFYNKNNTTKSSVSSHNHPLGESNGEVILGRLPNQSRGRLFRETIRVNRYLEFQEKRIKQAIIEGNFEKATIIGCSLLHRSIGYQIGVFNRAIPGWYGKLDSRTLSRVVIGAINKLRRGDLSLTINRFYILKKNGKERPIGAPSPTSKIISKAFTDMINAYSNNDRNNMQHGYRYHRGTHTALLAAVKKIQQGYSIKEFDFKSYFNTVSLSSVFKRIGKYGPSLSYTVSNMVAMATTIAKDGFHAEKEYELIEGSTYKKSGLPQGLSLSPVLATMVLEDKITPDNLVMYADDGLFFFRNNEKDLFRRGIDSLYGYGIRIEPEKTGTIVDKEFKFLGVTFDLTEKKLRYEGSSISMNSSDMELTSGFKHVVQGYGRKNSGGIGEINDTSIITTIKTNLLWYHKCLIIFGGLGSAESGRGYRFFLGYGIYDVIGSSSESINKLIYDVKKSGRLQEYKPMKLTEMGAFRPGPHKRKDYSFKIEHVGPPNYKPGTA